MSNYTRQHQLRNYHIAETSKMIKPLLADAKKGDLAKRRDGKNLAKHEKIS